MKINQSKQQKLEEFKLNLHPMHIAIQNNDFEFVKNNLDVKDDQVLYYAIKEDNKKVFEYVFPFFSLESQRKSLWFIAGKNRFDYLDFVLKYITVDQNDSRPHELACGSGNLKMVKILEGLGIKKSEYSFSYAFKSNNLELIKHVYDGEDLSKHFTEQTQVMPLDVLKFVMNHCELSEKNKHRVMLGAAYAGYIDVIEYLLTLPVPAESEGALFETVYFGEQLPTMKYLLTKAPILSQVSEDDYMAFNWAYKHKYIDFVDYLVNEHKIAPETSTEVYSTMMLDNLELYFKVLK